VLHLGCGRKRYDFAELSQHIGLSADFDTPEMVHLDADARLEPDIVHRLGGPDPLPLDDDSIDLIVAWHVLEHVGQQGETEGWFRMWEELYRVLKPSGWLYAESPYYDSIWAWSDPTHTRAISEHCFVFFAQAAYRMKDSIISPYRIHCDFQWLGMPGLEKGYAVHTDRTDPRNRMLRFALRPIKPLQPWWED
jgi:SAM-dependent methyltransferase